MGLDTSKIIHAPIGGGKYTVTSPLTKSDYGIMLVIEGAELPTSYQVDFSNNEHSGTSLTRIGGADGVEIPKQFIDTGKDVFAWLYWVGEDYGKTVYKFRIPNKCRPDRTNETPTPEEQSVIDQTISALNDAVESAQEAQQAIEDMSVSAESLLEGSEATVAKTESGGVVHLAFGIPVGATGAQGERGEKGEKGDRGEQGIQGIQGERGLTGAKGDKGDKGDTGAQGIQGIQGEKGEQGIQGEKGEKGDKGDKGDTGEVTTEEFLKAFVTDSASGSIASFPDGADDIPLKSLVVDIDPVQDTSSGDPSPENICPISGWTGCEVSATGKNLLDPSLLKDQVAWNIIPIYAPVGTVLIMSTDQPLASTSGLLTYFRTPGGAQGGSESVLNTHPVIKTVGEEGYLEVVQRNRDNIKSYADYEYQIEVGSTATAYEPYTGRSIPISWQTEAGTVYGGKLDVISGVLKVDRAEISSYNGEALPSTWISDRDVYAEGTTPTTGAQVVYMIATPITIQLTPQEVNSLLGVNNIWADTGDTEVEYRADTKLYIEKLTQPEEYDMIADSAITSGQFFMVGNSLYRALANIASGATITVGTNAQRVSLADALNLVNA